MQAFEHSGYRRIQRRYQAFSRSCCSAHHSGAPYCNRTGEGQSGHRYAQPVSRQHETEYLRYYGYPLYWGGPNLWGMGEYPVPGFIGAAPIPADVRQQRSLYGDKPPGDVHLRSAQHDSRCAIEAVDGSIGHIRGFIFDDEAGGIRYFVSTLAPGGRAVRRCSWRRTGSTTSTGLPLPSRRR
jgi:hypothetical protein